jgi:hypothetical protein
VSTPNPPNLRESDCCTTCFYSKFVGLRGDAVPPCLLCTKHGNLVVRGSLVCDDYRG